MIKPDHGDIVLWANTLFIDFPQDVIPILQHVERWRDWGRDLVVRGSFFTNHCPQPTPVPKGETEEESLKAFQEWALQIYKKMCDLVGS